MIARYALLAALLAAALPTTARAEISVDEAAYAAGVTVIRGRVDQPGAYVSLDRRYSTRARRSGRFVFRVRYLPNDCVVDLRAGGERRPVEIENCTLAGGVFVPRAPVAR